MARQVLGAGVGRSGTLSLKLALETLGIGRCYHMLECRECPAHAGGAVVLRGRAGAAAAGGGGRDVCVRRGHLSFHIAIVDYDAWKAHLSARGVPIVSEVTFEHGGRSLYLDDPAGNVLRARHRPLAELLAWPYAHGPRWPSRRFEEAVTSHGERAPHRRFAQSAERGRGLGRAGES